MLLEICLMNPKSCFLQWGYLLFKRLQKLRQNVHIWYRKKLCGLLYHRIMIPYFLELHDLFLILLCLRKGTLDEDAVKEILVDRHDFSEERVNQTLEKIKKVIPEEKSSLKKWF